jgi:hypothetical protein
MHTREKNKAAAPGDSLPRDAGDLLVFGMASSGGMSTLQEFFAQGMAWLSCTYRLTTKVVSQKSFRQRARFQSRRSRTTLRLLPPASLAFPSYISPKEKDLEPSHEHP